MARWMALALVGLFATSSGAATRAILIPNRSAILIMEGFSSAGQDPDVRRFYESLAVAPVQQAGGEGKVITVGNKQFNLACSTKNTSANSIVCNITVKQSAFSKIAAAQAEYHADGAIAQTLYEKFAGSRGGLYTFTTSDHTLTISSSPEKFDFYFHY